MFLTKAKIPDREPAEAGRQIALINEAKLRVEAGMLRLVWRVSRLLGPERASNLGASLLNRFSGPQSQTMKRFRRNLKIVLPDEDAANIDKYARQGIANLGRSVAEYPHLRQIAGPKLGDFIEFTSDTPDAALSATRPAAIYIGVHQANWEILSSIAAPLGKPMTIVVSPLGNPQVHRLVSGARPDAWVEQSEKDNATRSLIRCLQEGRSVGLLADQRFEGGQPVPFFGHNAMTAIGPAKIAIKFDCDLVPTRIERVGPVKFKITTFEAIRPDPKLESDQAKAIDMMRRVNQHFEAWIKEKPGEWMCMKRRWPNAVYQGANAVHTSAPSGSKIHDITASQATS